MSVTRPFVLIIATMAGAFVPAHAQRRGTLELGAFAHYSVYDTDIGLDDGTGFGGRLGWFFSDNWSIEADGGFVPTTIKATSADVDHVPVHIRFMGNVVLGSRLALVLGGGYAYNSFSNGLSASENGIGGVAGLRIRMGNRFALRGEALADYMFDQAVAADPNLHYAFQAGVSLLLGAGPRKEEAPTPPVKDTTQAKPVSPALAPVAAALVLEGVTFLPGTAKLALSAQAPLDRAIVRLRERGDLRVLIEGHTDNVGSRDANIRLSKERADAVRDYFISKGIAANRLTTVGIGPDQPIVSNDTPEGRAKNNRIQLRDQP